MTELHIQFVAHILRHWPGVIQIWSTFEDSIQRFVGA